MSLPAGSRRSYTCVPSGVLSAVGGLGARVAHTVHDCVGPDLARLAAARPELRLARGRLGRRATARRRTRWMPHGIALGGALRARDVAGEHLLFVGRLEWSKGLAAHVGSALALDRRRIRERAPSGSTSRAGAERTLRESA